MFLRRFERRKNGKPHSYWALAESYRTAKGSRQRIVAYQGELSDAEQNGWAKLGSHLTGAAAARRPQRTLFDPPRRDVPREDEPLLVRLSSIRLQRTREFGDVWLAWGLWRMLGLDELLEQLIEPGREDVSWGTMAAILTIARFCEPSSELHIADTWYRRTALEELLAGQRLGRLRQQNWRASQAFDVTIKPLVPPRGKQRLEITWQRQAKFADWSQLADGCYLLRSNLKDVDAATLWRRYIQLTEAEWAFRITKDELTQLPQRLT